MSWTRRWAIVGSIALAHVGVAVGYQAFLTDSTPMAYAQTANAKEVEPQLESIAPSKLSTAPPPVTTSLIPVPVQPAPAMLPDNVREAPPLPSTVAAPMPGLPKGPSSVTQSILPVSAQEPAAPPPAPGTPLPMTGTILTPTPQAAPAPPAAGELNIMPPNMPTNAAPPAAVKSTPKQPANCPWNLTVEIVGGRTLLTAQNGKDVKFTVSCEKLDMATPSGSIQAWGKVKLSTDSIEGNCEKLTISWQEDVVTLEKVQLKFKLEGHEADLNAEQLRVRLSRVVSSAREEQACSLWGFFR